MRTPIHRYTEKWTKHPFLYYLRFRDLLNLEQNKLSQILQRPRSNLVNPDTHKTCVHPISTHLMLAPKMRGQLIEELEYQHENAATPSNMVREDPLNYEAYATDVYSSKELKERVADLVAKKHPSWLEALERTTKTEIAAQKVALRKSEEKKKKYPYLEVRGVIRLQMEAIKQCESDSGSTVL